MSWDAAYAKHENRQDRKQDTLLARRIADLKRRGVVYLTCDWCGANHGLSQVGEDCNAAHYLLDGEVCGGPLREHILT